ncbi:helix-turn-helix domain-containing protein [Aquimarina macrocephali]|uniref:helix-turn-helix domain-containing protein n=1 Tax=Aquimarina macrocephali TaxID=666563 RepID=UPI003F661189
MELKEKIEKILLEEEIKASDFMSITGISKTAFYAIRNGKTRKLSEETAKSISDNFPKYQYKWLMSSDGSDSNKQDYIGKNNQIKVDEFVDIFFLYQEKIEENERFQTYKESVEKDAIIKYQHDLINKMNKKKEE